MKKRDFWKYVILALGVCCIVFFVYLLTNLFLFAALCYVVGCVMMSLIHWCAQKRSEDQSFSHHFVRCEKSGCDLCSKYNRGVDRNYEGVDKKKWNLEQWDVERCVQSEEGLLKSSSKRGRDRFGGNGLFPEKMNQCDRNNTDSIYFRNCLCEENEEDDRFERPNWKREQRQRTTRKRSKTPKRGKKAPSSRRSKRSNKKTRKSSQKNKSTRCSDE